ncbi:MAG: PQQ-like beta-propeller repeat protein [Kiritimatiellae bacterium]|nr:PQQ-like beta-propeller repeat protein [Kiritimatiellia bacterium]
MRRSLVVMAGLCMGCGMLRAAAQDGWPRWRGPGGDGAAPDADPPLRWSESENVKWKADIPGFGHATPVVWGDLIFVQTAVETEKGAPPEPEAPQPAQGQRPGGGRRRGPQAKKPKGITKFIVFAFNRENGKIVWQRTLREELPHEGTQPTASYASNSPVTDGECLYAYFGSRGLYALDMQGNVKWQKDLGKMKIKMSFGEGSSPALYGDTLVVNWDQEGQSFLVALNKRNGDQLWKVDRDEGTSWATPLVVQVDGNPQVIVSATKRVRGYDLATGARIWECGGMTGNVVPSPVYADGVVYVMSGFRGAALRAIRLAEAKGDITDSAAVLWRQDKDTPYVPSPLLYKGCLYFLKTNKGVLSCVEAKTGQAHYTAQPLEGLKDVYASLTAARDRIYIVDRRGTAVVIKHGPQFELLATNQLNDGFSASPVMVGNELYLRGKKHLYCIAAK